MLGGLEGAKTPPQRIEKPVQHIEQQQEGDEEGIVPNKQNRKYSIPYREFFVG